MKNDFAAPAGLNDYCAMIGDFVKTKGFYTPSSIEESESMLMKLMLVVTEVAEAAEAVRHRDNDNFVEEIADTLIRLFDIVGAIECDIEHVLESKMNVNAKREFRHGKVC